jgi:hypothetical protein
VCTSEQIRAGQSATLTAEGKTMLQTVAIVLVVMWLLGMVTAYTMGGFIHLLLVLAVITVLLRVIQGRSII